VSPNGPYRGKRLVDLALLVVLTIPAAVLMGFGALAVACTSRGPVLFRHERIGRDGAPYTLLKFRTMRHDPRRPIGYPDASLVTPVGRVLRRLSLDELPQLWNVACGSMSIVGPRPTIASQVARYDERQRGRLSVRPGLTGLAQVRGRNALPWPERIDVDLEYVRTQSVGLDLRILLSTVRTVLSGEGIGGHPADDPIAAPDGHTR
jgi:lipopolysaccharide/colanic/teichoic acid biosynthesis glycosyltransferase